MQEPRYSRASLSDRIEYRIFRTVKNRIKKRLAASVIKDLNGTVNSGPFKGMRLSGKSAWSSDAVSMLLGEYESEISSIMGSTDFSKHDIVIDVGSADGYFAIGLAMMSQLPVIAYEMSDESRRHSKENAGLNNVLDRITFRDEATPSRLAGDLRAHRHPFLLVDIEGSEVDLFDEEICDLLQHATLIIESHDVKGKRSVDILAARLTHTHEVSFLSKAFRDPFRHEALSAFSEDFAYLMLSEERGAYATWARFIPATRLG